MVVPIYGFVEGDTVGLLVSVRDDQSLSELAELLLAAARVRLEPFDQARIRYQGQLLDPRLTVTQAGIKPLDRVDVVKADSGSSSDGPTRDCDGGDGAGTPDV